MFPSLSAGDVARLCPKADPAWANALVTAWPKLCAIADLTTLARARDFLSQTAEESGGFRVFEENLNYTASRLREVWPKRFPTLASAQPYAGNPQALAEFVYGGRVKDLGNSQPGDGWRFHGRGPIQVTGRAWSEKLTKRLGINLVTRPEMMLDPIIGWESAAAVWAILGCNAYADRGDFEGQTRVLNGGLTNLAERKRYRAIAQTLPMTAAASPAGPAPVPARAPAKAPATALPWLALAIAERGVTEAPGPADNPVVVRYYKEAGHPEIQHDAVAWCAAFAGAMLRRAGLASSGSLAARSYESYGQALSGPVFGCVGVMKRGTSWQGHVGFVVGASASQVVLLGGNQGDAVSIATFPRSAFTAFRWPAGAAIPADLPKLPATLAAATVLVNGWTAPPAGAAPSTPPLADPALPNGAQPAQAAPSSGLFRAVVQGTGGAIRTGLASAWTGLHNALKKEG